MYWYEMFYIIKTVMSQKVFAINCSNFVQYH